MQKPQFDSWVGRIPLEKGKTPHSSILVWRIPWADLHGVIKSQTRLSHFHTQLSSMHSMLLDETAGGLPTEHRLWCSLCDAAAYTKIFEWPSLNEIKMILSFSRFPIFQHFCIEHDLLWWSRKTNIFFLMLMSASHDKYSQYRDLQNLLCHLV